LISQAEAARIREVDAALRDSCETSKQRELVNTTGTALSKAKSSVVLGGDIKSLGGMLAGTQSF